MFEGWGAAIGIGAAATIGSSVISSNAAGNAANAQVTASQSADNTQLQMYNQTRTDQTPWRTAGGSAVGALSSYYGLPGANGQSPNPATTAANDSKLISSLPGYQFNMQQGNQAVQRDLAAQGLLGSGAAAKALTQYGQGVASQYAGQYVNGLQSLAGIGQTSVQSTGAAGANAANQIGSNQIYAGNAQASGYANQANALGSGLAGLSGIYSNYNMQQQLNQSPQFNNNGSNASYSALGSSYFNPSYQTPTAGFDPMNPNP